MRGTRDGQNAHLEPFTSYSFDPESKVSRGYHEEMSTRPQDKSREIRWRMEHGLTINLCPFRRGRQHLP